MSYNARRGYPGSQHYAVLIAIIQGNAGLEVDGKHGPNTTAVISARSPKIEKPGEVADPFAGWVYPMPMHEGRRPEVSSGFSKNGSGPNKSRRNHWGNDIMYRRHEGDGGPVSASGKRKARHPVYTRGWYCHRVDALAVGPGYVHSVNRGWVLLDHGNVPGHGPLATWYQHLHEPLVERGDEVAAGQVIGIVGATYTDINHLHFEWRDCNRGKGRADTVVDPEPFLRRLAVVG